MPIKVFSRHFLRKDAIRNAKELRRQGYKSKVKYVKSSLAPYVVYKSGYHKPFRIRK